MGHNDLSQSLENLESAAAEIFRSLSSVTEAIASDMESASYDKYQDVLPKVKANLDELASTVAELKSELNAEVGTFSDALLEPMKLSMGNEASEEIDRLTSKTDLTLENLNAFLRLASTRLKDLGDDVDNKAKEVRQRGKTGRATQVATKNVHGLLASGTRTAWLIVDPPLTVARYQMPQPAKSVRKSWRYQVHPQSSKMPRLPRARSHEAVSSSGTRVGVGCLVGRLAIVPTHR
eukprot:symbB.v1.2.023523.t1/scaffold2155.1/size87741/4